MVPKKLDCKGTMVYGLFVAFPLTGGRGAWTKRRERQGRRSIKHSAAIHIENNITFVQRRAFNALLSHAYNELETEEEHSYTHPETHADLIGYDSHE